MAINYLVNRITYLSSSSSSSSSFFVIGCKVGVGFNRDKWEQLERHVRGLTKLYANVYVCTGPLYLPKRDLGDGKNYVRYVSELLMSTTLA